MTKRKAIMKKTKRVQRVRTPTLKARLTHLEEVNVAQQREILRLRGVIDNHEVEAEQRHRKRAEIAEAKCVQLVEKVRSFVRAYAAYEAFYDALSSYVRDER